MGLAAAAPVLNTPILDGTNPTITIGETEGLLKDLMHSNGAKGKSSSDGIVQLPFEHALAAVNFMIGKQDEQFDPERDRQLQHVKVTKIVLKNVAKQATMDVKTGVWTPDVTEDRVVYENETGFAIPEISTEIGPKDYLVFPTYGEQVSVEVWLEGLEQYNGSGYELMNKTFEAPGTGLVVSEGKCKITYDLRRFDDKDGTDVGALTFDRNHKYQLAIFVMRDNVRIVAISPQVYDWLDVNLDLAKDPHVTTLGQPITFGGTVWMDRNLGAKSADCETDWLHTLGYWWEYARNIPFMMDVDVFERNHYRIDPGKSYAIVDADGNRVEGRPDRNPAWKDYFIYTFDQYGNKVSAVGFQTLKQLAALPENAGKSDREILAIDPGDPGSYAFVAYYNGTTYWYDTKANNHIHNYWYNINNQPVPKGWRLPNAKDVYSIMPEQSINWYYDGNRLNKVGIPTPLETKDQSPANEFVENYKFSFVYGNYTVNTSADKSQELSDAIIHNDKLTRLYGIKHQGTDKAYRYSIIMYDSTVPNGRYVRFSQFPTTKDDKFIVEGTKWNLHQFDWDHPSAYMDFPLQGHLISNYSSSDPAALINIFGREIKIRLQDRHGEHNWCMKLSNDGTGVANTWQSTTCPTRLVRDI